MVAGVDPEQPVAAVNTMEKILELNVADRRQQMTLLTAFAALAVLLASLGLYGVLAYTVSQRSREIGLRMDLGASESQVVGMVVLRGVALSAVGLTIGMAAAWALSRTMSRILFAVAATDHRLMRRSLCCFAPSSRRLLDTGTPCIAHRPDRRTPRRVREHSPYGPAST